MSLERVSFVLRREVVLFGVSFFFFRVRVRRSRRVREEDARRVGHPRRAPVRLLLLRPVRLHLRARGVRRARRCRRFGGGGDFGVRREADDEEPLEGGSDSFLFFVFFFFASPAFFRVAFFVVPSRDVLSSCLGLRLSGDERRKRRGEQKAAGVVLAEIVHVSARARVADVGRRKNRRRRRGD